MQKQKPIHTHSRTCVSVEASYHIIYSFLLAQLSPHYSLIQEQHLCISYGFCSSDLRLCRLAHRGYCARTTDSQLLQGIVS